MKKYAWALAPLAAASLVACNPADKTDPNAPAAAATPSSKTLAESVKGMGKLEGAVTNAGLGAVLEGKGPYTVFAPADAAFPAGLDLSAPQMKAQAAEALKAHIVPGALTRADIDKAIAAESDGKVEMRTMADGVLTFSREGDAVVVTAPDGAQARLTGSETLASNGVVQPIDALLIKAPTT